VGKTALDASRVNEEHGKRKKREEKKKNKKADIEDTSRSMEGRNCSSS
jgi:hypothetical protein